MGLWIYGAGNNGTAHWEPEPDNGRGTWSILSSYIITLTLCVYTSLHINIPAPKSSTVSILRVKFFLVLVGLLTPEVLVFNALEQWTFAHSITAKIRKARGGEKAERLPRRILRWLRLSFRKEQDGSCKNEACSILLRFAFAVLLRAPVWALPSSMFAYDKWRSLESETVLSRFQSLSFHALKDVCRVSSLQQSGSIKGHEGLLFEQLLLLRAFIPLPRLPRRLHLTWNVQERLPSVADNDPWAKATVVHGFYIAMGGFTLDVSQDASPRVWPRNVDCLTLGSGVVTECLISSDQDIRQIIPFVSEAYINDKNKANKLAKLIVCIQATWFCTQCIARLIQRLPISLLELNTFAHSICALLIYALWWKKPLDIEEATSISTRQSKTIRDLAAFCWSSNTNNLAHLQQTFDLPPPCWKNVWNFFWKIYRVAHQRKPLNDADISEPQYHRTIKDFPRRLKISNFERLSPHPELPQRFQHSEWDACDWVSTSPPVFSLKRNQKIPTTSLYVAPEWSSVEIDDVLLERLKTMEQIKTSSKLGVYKQITCLPDLLLFREPDFSDWSRANEFSPNSESLRLGTMLGIACSGLFYGGLHLTGWGSATIQTPVEQLLWTISAFTVTFGGIFGVLQLFAFSFIFDRLNPGKIGSQICALFPVLIGCCSALLYLGSRVFLLFEVFRSLAFVDQQIYQTTNVSQYSLRFSSLASQPSK